MIQTINTTEFATLRHTHTVIDVRTPLEFTKGHIPGAYNLPLFSNEERAKVGTLYKTEGKYPAILKGLDFVGPKMSELLRAANKLSNNKPIIVYCWRGGMRSDSISWLLQTGGIDVKKLVGGYKAFRREGKTILAQKYKLIILGGKTGSGKTKILHNLKSLGEQVIDLEDIAHHKGSAFGTIGMPSQTQNEQFENNLIDAFREMDIAKRLWLEDESKNIGRNYIPDALFLQMRNSPVLFIEVPHQLRIQNLISDYAQVQKETLQTCLEKITKRLGRNNLQEALEALEQNDFKTIAEVTLRYYDKAYMISSHKRDKQLINKITFHTTSFQEMADLLIQEGGKIYPEHT
jgi:tRNA 2-selenouridine synthase